MNENQLHPTQFFDLADYEHKALFDGIEYVWEAYGRLDQYLDAFFEERKGQSIILGEVKPGAILDGDRIYIGPGAKVEPTAYIQGPTIIGPESIVGTAAYIRAGTITGRKCVIGHCTEAVRTIMLNHAWAPHFNFIGHSILGNDSNIGAGVILANFRLDGSEVPSPGGGTTGLIKFGAALGDRVKIACNAVTEPGMFLKPDCWIMPCAYTRRGLYERGEKRVEIKKIM